MSDNGESSNPQYSVSEDGETLTVYMPVDGNSVSSSDRRKLRRLMKKFKQVRIVKLSSKKGDDDHDDESDTSTLVGGEDIGEKTKAALKR